MNRTYFTGFASGVSDKSVHDYELIIQDLLNHIYTRKGERLLYPEYGSIIWDLIFELKSVSVENQIRNDLITIIESEPRVKLQDLKIISEENGYSADITLYFNSFNVAKKLQIDFNNRINTIENVE